MTYEGSQAINPSLYASQPFDSVKDFQPVATLAQAGFYVICDPKLPVKDLKELLAFARSRADPINYATSGVGSVNHLVGEMIKFRSGVPMVHVPFRGISEAISNIMGGHVQAGVAAVPSVIGQVRSGSVRALAVSSARRIAVTPDVPTVAEAGLDGFDVNPWWGILGFGTHGYGHRAQDQCRRCRHPGSAGDAGVPGRAGRASLRVATRSIPGHAPGQRGDVGEDGRGRGHQATVNGLGRKWHDVFDQCHLLA